MVLECGWRHKVSGGVHCVASTLRSLGFFRSFWQLNSCSLVSGLHRRFESFLFEFVGGLVVHLSIQNREDCETRPIRTALQKAKAGAVGSRLRSRPHEESEKWA